MSAKNAESRAEKRFDNESLNQDHTLRSKPWMIHTTPWSDIISHKYQGQGTEELPYVVTWLPDDPSRGFKDRENPMTFVFSYKWIVTMVAAFGTLGVTMASSMLSAAISDIRIQFPGYNDMTYIMTTSGFLIGFVIGPLLWAPGSEVFGRRMMFIVTYIPFTAFNAACCGAKSLPVLIVLRSFAGIFGSSATVNAGGTIADMFPAHQRGLAMGIFAAAPFLGPAIGPVAGGFLSEAEGWVWVAALIAFVSLVLCIMGVLFSPETYSPFLLRRRATRMSKFTGKVYRSQPDVVKPLDKQKLFMNQLKVPWILMFKEPIVFLMSLYMSVIYAILYMQFTSFPLIFQRARGWSPGVGGLAFIGITVGAFIALGYIIFYENPRYSRASFAAGGYLAPESRFPSVLLGAFIFPIGLFWFAWTGVPVTIHWIAPLIATAFIGAGIVLLFLGVMNYLVDAYLLYAASVLAGAAVMRSIFAVILPLFTVDIFDRLGINWAGTLIAFLALAFVPAPFIFYFYGARIRRWSKFAREADDMGQMMAKRAMAARAQQAKAETEQVISHDTSDTRVGEPADIAQSDETTRTDEVNDVQDLTRRTDGVTRTQISTAQTSV
ncbi:uncharacterized protein IL334_006884 [Kwoniella shivajii]|uniref:Major facilitator superfamily (MFS) profile domain-containing protein n=1 Tax=Kwoniella shivajii TaxID=564305 RepID=A0ABZ1D782_9TREE|nr:hypothetical protein IL334_006884 [Kwoniella shivajii]